MLGDSAESPRFVETLPRRGYRFIGGLTTPERAVIPVEPNRGSHSGQKWLKIAAGILAISVFALGGLVAFRWSRHQPPQDQAILTVVPFTALPGEEISPAFSPDGSRIAFAWNGDPPPGVKGFDLYVKAIGSETMLRLTQHASEWMSPAWSPDGTQIAFHRLAGTDTGIYVVPALGGPERKLRSTRIPWTNFSIIGWSPDGKWIAFDDFWPDDQHARIYLLSPETLETKRITDSPKCIGEGQPDFSHSGEYLAYSCFRSPDEFALNTLRLMGGQPKMISLFRGSPHGVAWSADDKQLIYSRLFPNSMEAVTLADGSVHQFAFAGSAERATDPEEPTSGPRRQACL